MNVPWQKGSVGSYSCPAKRSGRHLKKNSFKKGTAFEFNTCIHFIYLFVCSGPGSKVEWASSFSDFTQII